MRQLEKHPQNAAGKFYVTEDCLACENCQIAAPNNFRYDDNGVTYIFKQPNNAEEEAQCQKALEDCPMEAIGTDDSDNSVPRISKWFFLPPIICAVFLLAIQLTGRIAIGLHWATDVIVGLLGGWVLALLACVLSSRLAFGRSRVAQIIFAVVIGGAAVRMFLINRTDYPQAFRLLQTIALGSIVFTICEFALARILARRRRPIE